MTSLLLNWLEREFFVLAPNMAIPDVRRAYVVILNLTYSDHILSPSFRGHIAPYFGSLARNFQHEFFQFCSHYGAVR
jgi:hypothetical protein